MFLSPKLPDFDVADWRDKPFAERTRMICQAWAADGYGSPLAIYLLYALKIAAYIYGWIWWCSFTPGQSLATISTWWATPDAFAKAMLWTMLFEGIGFGCGSGPLTGRYLPPMGGALYFLRPGTTKLPLWPGLPIVGGSRRTPLDIALYATVLALLARALMAPAITSAQLLPILLLVPLLGLFDKTLFLVFRSEHYLSVLVCLMFTDWIAGSKVVWMAIWWWAATSKLNVHFPAVMGVMTSNAPFTRGTALRRMVYRDAPHDLRASGTAATMAHFGTVSEYLVPLLLLMGDGGTLTMVGLVIITAFHLFILVNVPMGVPLEWNVVMIYGAWVLFGVHAGVGILTLHTPALWLWLLAMHLVLPLYGSLYPDRVSFLLSMRYYAGNWAYNVWLFRGDSSAKLDRLTKSAPHPNKQLAVLYDEDTIAALLAKVVAFRHMHILGRALHQLVPRAVEDVDAYEWIDGEIVAGLVVGWNFGEGHLSNDQLMRAVQEQCFFEEGELRCICVESQPLFGRDVAWSVHDARTGPIAAGIIDVYTLAELHPWPT